MSNRTCWIGVVSRSHVQIGVKGGFIQLNHGKKAPLQKFHAGDGLVMYSPRTSYPDGEPLQSFTARGSIASGEIYQVEMSSDFKPFRVDVRFSTCHEAPIKPMIDKLSFITNKTHWGAAFALVTSRFRPPTLRSSPKQWAVPHLPEMRSNPFNRADR